MKPLDHAAALELRFDSDIGDNETIRTYLYSLLSTLWHEEEGFGGKRPFGNSGWQSGLYTALAKEGYVEGDADGYVPRGPARQHAEKVMQDLIYFALYGIPKP